MFQNVLDTLYMSSHKYSVIERFIEATKELSPALHVWAELHLFLSILDTTVVDGNQGIDPMHSKLFLRELEHRKIASE